jgi:hypothetical protein
MSGSTPSEIVSAAHSSPASLMGRIPITLFMRDGTLALADGRLAFTTSRRTVFDHPVSGCHSVAASGRVGFHVWHGDRCYKLVPSYTAVSEFHGGNAAVETVVNVARLPAAFAADRRMRDAREQWIEVLEPLVGAPPPGVRVRRPWPTWAILLVVVAVTLGIVAAVTAFTLLTS